MNAWELCDLLAIGHVRLWNGNMCIRKWPSKFPANLKLTWSEKVTAVYRLALVTLMKHPRTSHLTLVQPIYLYVPTILNCFAMLRQGAKIAGEQTQHQALVFLGKVVNVKNSQLVAVLKFKGIPNCTLAASGSGRGHAPYAEYFVFSQAFRVVINPTYQLQHKLSWIVAGANSQSTLQL